MVFETYSRQMKGLLAAFGLGAAFMAAAPQAHAVDVSFDFSAPAPVLGPFAGPDSFEFTLGGVTQPAAGASGSFADDGDILTFDLSGGFSSFAPNAFNAFDVSLMLSFTNNTATISTVSFDPSSILASASHAGLGNSGIFLSANGGPALLDSAVAIGPTGVSGEALDISGLAPIVLNPGESEDLQLTLIFQQFHILPGETSTYDVAGTIAFDVEETMTQIPAPGPVVMLLTGLAVLAGMRKTRK